MNHVFTAAQIHALEWLPGDGSWCGPAGRMAQALASLRTNNTPTLIEVAWNPLSRNKSRYSYWHYRLTLAGIEARKELRHGL